MVSSTHNLKSYRSNKPHLSYSNEAEADIRDKTTLFHEGNISIFSGRGLRGGNTKLAIHTCMFSNPILLCEHALVKCVLYFNKLLKAGIAA
jgi:hypothetical protein